MDKLTRKTRRGSNVSDIRQEKASHWNINPLTRRGRSRVFLGLVILPLLSGLAVLIYSSVDLSGAIETFTQSQELIDATETAMESLDLLRALQEYTTMFSIYKDTNYTGMFGPLESFSLAVSERTTEMMSSWYHSSGTDLNNLAEMLKPFEENENGNQKPNSSDIDYPYSQNVQNIVTSSMNENLMTNRFNAWSLKVLFIEVSESYVSLSVEKGLSVLYYLSGNLTDGEQLTLEEQQTIAQEHLHFALLQSDVVNQQYSEDVERYPSLVPGMQEAKNLISKNADVEGNLYEGVELYHQYGILQNILLGILQDLFEQIKTVCSKEKRAAVDVIIWSVCKMVAFLFAMLPFVVISANMNIRSLLIYSITMERYNQELRKEKRKIDQILNQMLPKAVAHKLRRGETVGAEEYEQSTIFFSDIDNFDIISGHSSPMEIVTFLNDIYNFMDNQLERYDVYKVETIGCVYMVVSGVPMRNGNRHASEIARMALNIINTTENYIIAHLPDMQLMIRIGIHSGPVVAGVIGNITPRYCLFGDSVNTASRMQSHGLARRIHMSEPCRQALDKMGGFMYEERGQVQIKGKGLMTTYWLTARHDTQGPAQFPQTDHPS